MKNPSQNITIQSCQAQKLDKRRKKKQNLNKSTKNRPLPFPNNNISISRGNDWKKLLDSVHLNYGCLVPKNVSKIW